MSIKIMSSVWEHAEVDPLELLMLLCLADYSDDHGRNIWPSVATLARKARTNERTVQRRLKKMREDGWISIDTEAKQHKSRCYRLNLDMLPGVTSGAPGVTTRDSRGDIAVSPNPSENPPTESPPMTPQVQMALVAYNQRAHQHGWSVATKMTSFRRRHLPARIRDAEEYGGWEAALDRIPRSSFLMGRSDRPFRMTLDSLLGEKLFTKLLEGGFDDAERKVTARRGL